MKKNVFLLLSLPALLLLASMAPAAGPLQPMRQKGNGTSTFQSGNCSETDCFAFEAEADGKPIRNGNFKGLFNVGDSFVNHRDENCQAMDGQGRFKKGGDRIFVVFEGTACVFDELEDLARGKAYAKVTGGTGDWEEARGKGGLAFRFVYSQGENLPFSYAWDGTIKG